MEYISREDAVSLKDKIKRESCARHPTYPAIVTL